MPIWLVMQYRILENSFEVQGCFDSKEKAEAACRTELYCVIPLILNESLPDETIGEFGYYPKQQQ